VAKVPLQCQGFSQAMHGTQSEAMVHLTGGATETMNALSVLNKLKESKVYVGEEASHQLQPGHSKKA